MLCVFAWLASNVGSKLRTIFNRNTRDWHRGEAKEDQRLTSNDITQKGTISLSSLDEVGGGGSPRLRGETEGAAAALSPLVPTNVGTQGRTQPLSRLAASTLRTQQNRSWIPRLILSLSKDVGMSGSCCTKSA